MHSPATRARRGRKEERKSVRFRLALAAALRLRGFTQVVPPLRLPLPAANARPKRNGNDSDGRQNDCLNFFDGAFAVCASESRPIVSCKNCASEEDSLDDSGRKGFSRQISTSLKRLLSQTPSKRRRWITHESPSGKATPSRHVDRLEFQKEFIWTHVESFGDFQQNCQCRRTFAALDSAHIIRMNISLLREGFLAEPRLFPIIHHGPTDCIALIFLEHSALRKQKRRRVTTHAPCRFRISRLQPRWRKCRNDQNESAGNCVKPRIGKTPGRENRTVV